MFIFVIFSFLFFHLSSSQTACDWGEYSKDGNGTIPCLPCPFDKTTVNLGTETIDECICLVNEYGPPGNSSGCTLCDEHYEREDENELSETFETDCLCIPGRAGESCDECPVNTYSDQFGSANCTSCGENQITLFAGSNSSSSCVCNGGFYMDAGSCTECFEYSGSNAGSTSISDCTCASPHVASADGLSCIPEGFDFVQFMINNWYFFVIGIVFILFLLLFIILLVIIVVILAVKLRSKDPKQSRRKSHEEIEMLIIDRKKRMTKEMRKKKKSGKGEKRLSREIQSFNENLFNVTKDDIEISHLISEEGSYASVYNCEYDGKTVAYKLIKEEILFEEDIFAQIERQISLISTLNHPNLLLFYGTSCDKKLHQIGLVVEYCENGNIRDYIKGHKKNYLYFVSKIEIIKGVCSGMQYFHDLEIIHRELKCENVFLDKSLSPKINIDSGMVRIVKEFRKVEGKGKDEGFSFAAPELVLGKKDYGYKSDVYSFAFLMLQILSENFKLFSDEEGFNIHEKMANDPKFRPKIDKDKFKSEHRWIIDDIIKPSWSSNVKDRKSFKEIKSSLSRKF